VIRKIYPAKNFMDDPKIDWNNKSIQFMRFLTPWVRLLSTKTGRWKCRGRNPEPGNCQLPGSGSARTRTENRL